MFLIAVACYAMFEKIKANEKNDTNKTLVSVGQLKTHQIQSYLAERSSDAAVISSFLTTPSAQHWLAHQGGNAPAILKHLMESVMAAYQYRGLLALDAEANIRLNTGRSGILTETGKAIALHAMHERSHPFFKIYFGDPATPDEPVLDTFVPVMSPDGTRAVGMVVLRSEPKFLFQLIQTWPVESETAETLLVTKDGSDVLFLNELRHQKNTTLKLRVPLSTDTSSLAWPAISAVTGHFGLLEANDYRGKRITAYAIAVPDTPWSMVVKMDIEEAVAHSQRLLRVAMIIAAILIVFAGMIVWLWWRKDQTDRLANKQLQESETRYRRLHESMMDAFVMVDMSGRLLDFNNTFLEMLGYSAEELKRMTYMDLTPEKWLELSAGIVKNQIIPHGQSEVYEKEFIRKNGATLPVELKVFLLRDANNQPEAMWAIVRDITERKQAEISMRQFGSLLQGSFNEIYLFDADSLHFLLTSEGAEKNLGYSDDELNQLTCLDIKPSFTRESFEQLVAPLRSGEQPLLHFETVHRRKDGTTYPVEVRLQLIQGDYPAFLAVIQDITERKQAEARLHKLAEKIEDLYNNAPCGYHSLDKDGVILIINETELAWLGYTRDEVIGKMKLTDMLMPAGIQTFHETFPQLKRQGFIHDVELEIIRKDGTTFTGLVSATAIYDASGNYVMSRSTVADITARKQAEQRLHDLAAHLQSVREEEKTGIAREIHDDLGGTLTALKMETYWLKTELSACKDAVPLLKRIGEMSQLIDNAMGVMRSVITGLRPTILDDLGLLAALEWQAAQFHKSTGIECRVNCVCATDEDCAEELDKPRSIALFRIVQEALTNVMRHSGASRVEIEFHRNDEEVVMSIIDNGCGMAKKRAVTSIPYGILGMCERVDQLGGKISFNTPPGGGFNVTVILPLPANEEEET
ncbi:MAG: PAS domain S-box protein [Gallionella sp.]|nr:PAS domain S-box protein [Gallionella sp.]